MDTDGTQFWKVAETQRLTMNQPNLYPRGMAKTRKAEMGKRHSSSHMSVQ